MNLIGVAITAISGKTMRTINRTVSRIAIQGKYIIYRRKMAALTVWNMHLALHTQLYNYYNHAGAMKKWWVPVTII